MRMEENKPLAPLTTFGIGGPGRWYVEAESEEDIREAVGWAGDSGVSVFALGGGSNLLVSDAGFDGLVIRVALKGIEMQEAAPGLGERMYSVAAGEDWNALVERTVEDRCAGLECLAGIPGTVGGTPVQNVGAYGQEVGSVIERVRVFDSQERTFREFSAEECGFSYRRSRFNSADRGRLIVTRVDYRLKQDGEPTLRYPDLQRIFAERAREGKQPTVLEVAAAVRKIRHTKGMLLVDGDADCRSAGSFFKNPIVSKETFDEVANVRAEEPPHFAAGPGQVKIPAAWLIENAGFRKGDRLGSAGISSRHTLALINGGNSTAAEVLELAEKIRGAVRRMFGIELEMEPVMVGF